MGKKRGSAADWLRLGFIYDVVPYLEQGEAISGPSSARANRNSYESDSENDTMPAETLSTLTITDWIKLKMEPQVTAAISGGGPSSLSHLQKTPCVQFHAVGSPATKLTMSVIDLHECDTQPVLASVLEYIGDIVYQHSYRQM